MPDNHKDYQDTSYIIYPKVPLQPTLPGMRNIVKIYIVTPSSVRRNADSIYITVGSSFSVWNSRPYGTSPEMIFRTI